MAHETPRKTDTADPHGVVIHGAPEPDSLITKVIIGVSAAVASFITLAFLLFVAVVFKSVILPQLRELHWLILMGIVALTGIVLIVGLRQLKKLFGKKHDDHDAPHTGGGHDHHDPGGGFLKRTRVTLNQVIKLGVIAVLLIIAFFYLNVIKMAAGYQSAKAAEAQRNAGKLRVEFSTNIFLNPGQQSIPILVYGHQSTREGPTNGVDKILPGEVIVEHIITQRVGVTTNGPIYVNLKTNIVGWQEPQGYSRSTELWVRYTLVGTTPRRIDFEAGVPY